MALAVDWQEGDWLTTRRAVGCRHKGGRRKKIARNTGCVSVFAASQAHRGHSASMKKIAMGRRKLSTLAFLAVIANGAAILFTSSVTSGDEPPNLQPGLVMMQAGGARFLSFQGEGYSDVVLPTERDEIRKLEKIGQLIAESRFSDAAILLDRMLEKEEDSFFVPGDDKTNFRSLKSEAARLIGDVV